MYVSASSQDDLAQVRAYLKESHLTEAKNLALEIKDSLEKNPQKEEYFRVNYLLGYIYKEEGDFGKAIIYYLESIRLAEENKEAFSSDLASLYNRCAIIYRQFKAYDLANEYYMKGIDLANAMGDQKMLVRLNFNFAGVYIDNEQYEEALNLLNKHLPLAKELDYKLDDYYNRIASVYLKSDRYSQALENYDILESLVKPNDYEMQGYLYHNMGLAYQGLGNNDYTERFLVKSIELKKKHTDSTILFSSYFDLGQHKFNIGAIDESLAYFNLAINTINDNPVTPSQFEVYKSKANALFQNSEYLEAKTYEDLYTGKLNDYLDLQEDLQEFDRKYNMDLITKRYFDKVARQERISDILLYSKAISGSLLALLLMTVGYNRYQKIKLRRSILEDLIRLKVVD